MASMMETTLENNEEVEQHDLATFVPNELSRTITTTIATQTKKLSGDAWQIIESNAMRFDANQRAIQARLNALGASADAQNLGENITTIGNDFYVKIREILKNYDIVKGNKTSSKSKYDHIGIVSGDIEHNEPAVSIKKGAKKVAPKKIDIIRFENTIKTVEQTIMNVLMTFSSDEMNYENGLSTKLLETRGITLMYCAWFILVGQPERYKKTKKIEDVYELIVGIQKFIKASTGYEGKSMIDSTKTVECSKFMLNDLQKWLDRLLKTYPMDGHKLYQVAPRLLFFCKYDDACPSKGITPRQSQRNVMQLIQENQEGFLIAVKVMVNSGKTIFAGTAIPSFVKKYRQSNVGTKLQGIFCCGFESVCLDVASIAFANGIKFGYASVKDGKVKITNSYNCSEDSERILIIAGLDATLLILQEDERRIAYEKTKDTTYIPKSNYLLYFDELTAESDDINSDVLRKSMQILRIAPTRTILSSATLPTLTDLTNFIDHYKNRFPHLENKLFTVVSNEIQCGCDIFTFSGESVVPHKGCTTVEELAFAISIIEKAPFLGRLYTPLVVLKLWEDINKFNVPNLPNIHETFSDTNNMKADSVHKFGIQLLKCLVDINSNEIVRTVCKASYTEPQIITIKNNKKSEPVEDDDTEIKFGNDTVEESEEYNPNALNMAQLAGKDAHKLAGGITLIGTPDPLKFALEHFTEFIDMLSGLGIESVKKIIRTYEQSMEKYNEQVERLTMRTTSDDKLAQQMHLLQETKPRLNFPGFAQINTINHMKKFAAKYKDYIDRNSIRAEFPPETHPQDFAIDERLQLLLWCGIGIYIPGDSSIDSSYTTHIHNLMSIGQLAIVISNKKIMYGSNYPIRTVIASDDFSDNYSDNAMFQFFGRAGRVNLAYRATIYVGDKMAKRLFNMTHRKAYVSSIETENMNKMYYLIEQEEIAQAKLEFDKAQQEEIAKAKREEQRRIENEQKRIAEEHRILKEQQLQKALKEQALKEQALRDRRPSSVESNWRTQAKPTEYSSSTAVRQEGRSYSGTVRGNYSHVPSSNQNNTKEPIIETSTKGSSSDASWRSTSVIQVKTTETRPSETNMSWRNTKPNETTSNDTNMSWRNTQSKPSKYIPPHQRK